MSPTVTVEPTDRVLSEMRKRLGLSQLEAAQRSGIEQSKFSRWESHLLELSKEEVKALSDVIEQVMLERSEAGTLPPATTMDASAKEQGRIFRQQRLRWGIQQIELARAAKYSRHLISMWENGYVEMEPEEIEALGKVLASLIDNQNSVLQWWQDPGQLQKRREDLGLSRKRVAKHFGKPEKWVSDLEGGHVKITPEIADSLWDYLVELEQQQGKTVPLSAALSAPVIPSPRAALPALTVTKQVRMKQLAEENRRLEALNANLQKSLRLHESMLVNQEELSTLRTGQVNSLAEKVDELEAAVSELPESVEKVRHIVALMKAVFEE